MHPVPLPRARTTGAWLLAAGLAVLVLAGAWQRERIELPTHARRVPAEVVAIEQRVQRGSDYDETLYASRVRYTAIDGRAVEFVADVWSATPLHRPGDPVHVLVDTRQDVAVLDTRETLYGAFLALAGVGIALMLAGLRAWRRG